MALLGGSLMSSWDRSWWLSREQIPFLESLVEQIPLLERALGLPGQEIAKFDVFFKRKS